MYIVVVGGGKVGYYLTRELLEQGHEILLVERDQDRVDRLVEDLGNIAITGDGCEVSILAEAGAARADALVAVTGGDEDNLVSCQIAKNHFQVSRTMARVNNPKNERLFRMLGIDVTVSSTKIIMSMIEHEMPRRALLHLLAIEHMGVEIVEAVLTPQAPSVGRSIGELKLPAESTISVVLRDGTFVIPSGQLILKEGDEIIAMCKKEFESDLRTALLGSA